MTCFVLHQYRQYRAIPMTTDCAGQHLVAVADTLKHSNYYLFFPELNEKLNDMRSGDDLFQTQEKAFVIRKS